MSRRSLVVLILAVVALAGVRASAKQSPSLDDIVSKNLQAKGGVEKMKAVQTLKQTSHVTIAGVGEAMLTVYGRRPNLTRQEMVLGSQTLTQGFDGQTAWQVNPGTTVAVALSGPAADALKEQSDIDSPLLDYKAKGYVVELAGTDTVGDRKAYHLKLTKDQHVQHVYIDVATNLEFRVVADTPGGPVETELSDFREVDGLKFPFTVRQIAGGVEQVTAKIDKVEVNGKFDDGLFRMPKGD